MTEAPARIRMFVTPGSIEGHRARLVGHDAARLVDRGAKVGTTLALLDDSGWEVEVLLDLATEQECTGEVVGRRLADDRRTKISLYQGLLHPSDFRRLLLAGARAGVVSFVPVITDGSPVSALGLGASGTDPAQWSRIACVAAESAGRGHRPTVGAPMLLDHALDAAASCGAVMFQGPGGDTLAAALEARPFSIGLFCPPPGGFTIAEIDRARARGASLVSSASGGLDPVRAAVTALETIYSQLESDQADGA